GPCADISTQTHRGAPERFGTGIVVIAGGRALTVQHAFHLEAGRAGLGLACAAAGRTERLRVGGARRIAEREPADDQQRRSSEQEKATHGTPFRERHPSRLREPRPARPLLPTISHTGDQSNRPSRPARPARMISELWERAPDR